jgi:hypothetical protein
MPARIPTQQKSPFEIDPRPLHEMSSPHAGLLATSRAFRSLGIPALAAAHLQVKQRQRGFDEAQYLEAIVLLQTAGGDCPEDMPLLGNDPCLERGLGFPLPKVSAVRGFLERFHDEALEESRPPRAVQKSFIVPSSAPVEALQAVQAGVVRRIAQLYAEQQTALRIATVDQDATIIESHKAAAQAHYEGGRGYQPMVAVWAEADLVLADGSDHLPNPVTTGTIFQRTSRRFVRKLVAKATKYMQCPRKIRLNQTETVSSMDSAAECAEGSVRIEKLVVCPRIRQHE